jgi:hypothetical protein
MTRTVTHSCTSHLARRFNVVALGLVLCAWLITAAMHLHVQDPDSGSADSAHCTYCLGLSTSAAPAPEFQIPAIVDAPAGIVTCNDLAVEDRATPSFYLSRGPPTA